MFGYDCGSDSDCFRGCGANLKELMAKLVSASVTFPRFSPEIKTLSPNLLMFYFTFTTEYHQVKTLEDSKRRENKGSQSKLFTLDTQRSDNQAKVKFKETFKLNKQGTNRIRHKGLARK